MTQCNLKSNESFRALLIAERAALLARVDAIEQFLNMPLTKDLRKEAKSERRNSVTWAGTVNDDA